MKYFLAISLASLILSVFLPASFSFAQDNVNPTNSGVVFQHGRRRGDVENKVQPQEKDTISGECTVVPGGGNLLAGPCVNIALKLDDSANKKTYYARTTATGSFSFEVPLGAKYTIGVTSRLYEVESPTEPISSGKTAELHLKQK